MPDIKFTVTRTGDLSKVGSATWTLTPGKLLSGDLAPGQVTTGTVSWVANEAAPKVITIKTVGNTQEQADRDCEITLSNASNGTITVAKAVTRIIDDDVVTPPGTFVKKFDTIGFKAGRTVTRPAFNATGNNPYRPGTNETYDLRDRVLTQHIPHTAKNSIQIRCWTSSSGGLLTGFKTIGMQSRALTWQDVKVGHLAEANGGSWDDNGLLFGSSDAWPVGDQIVENFWIDNSCDGLNGPRGIIKGTPIIGAIARSYMRCGYIRYCRDDAWEFDSFTPSTSDDILVDGAYMGFSQRSLAPKAVTEPTYLSNCLVYLQRMPYNGDAASNGGAIYNAPWSLSNRGTRASGNKGWGHQWFVKGQPIGKGYSITADFRNCLFALEGLPISGDSPGLPWPPGVYQNVVVIYLGPGVPGSTGVSTIDSPPNGVTVLDYTHYDLWLSERDKWLRAHGCFDGTGDDFPFLHQ
jgi:hypothetical protein